MKPMAMMMIDPLGVPMERMGSGTTWIPDAVSLPARHRMIGSWLVMLHGFGFVQYDKQGGPRGDEQFGSLLLWGANRHSGRTSHSALRSEERRVGKECRAGRRSWDY